MIDKENFPMGEDDLQGQDDQNVNDSNPLSLEEQEQLNDEDLVERIEEEDTGSNGSEDIDDGTEEPSGGEDLQALTGEELQGNEGELADSDRPVTRNQLGDNPPGSEQAAFDSGNTGDMSREQVKYQDKDIAENFRENLDKASKEIDLDKRLKEDQ